VQAKVYGNEDFKLQSLVWSTHYEEAGRLFGISLKGFLFEVDLQSGTIINLQDTYSGAAWCLAASPRDNLLAIGGEDGIVRLFRYYSSHRIEYVKSLPTSSSRILSIAYHPAKKELLLGCSDGTIRCLDEETGRVVFRMTGDINVGVFTPCIWSLAVLSDSTIVSGDSRGQVQIWDGNVGVLVGTFVQHVADVLAIAISADESAIFASGIDGKVVCIQRSSAHSTTDNSNEVPTHSRNNHWVYAHSHRAHTHDVYSMAVVVKTSSSLHKKTSSIPGKAWTLLSGGLDSKISMYAADDFDRTRPVWMPVIPSNELICHSQNYERVVLRHRQHLDLWQINLQSSSSSGAISSSGGPIHDQCHLFLRLKISGVEHIHSCAISPKGDFLILSTISETKAWRIYYNPSISSTKVKLVKAKLPEGLQGKRSSSLRNLVFNKKGTMLAAWNILKKQIQLYEMKDNEEASDNEEGVEDVECMKLVGNFSYEANLLLEEENGGIGMSVVDKKLSNMIKRMIFSADGKFLAIANSAREVAVFNVKK
jgi:U3 small nucleolar RNA-associated protein 4